MGDDYKTWKGVNLQDMIPGRELIPAIQAVFDPIQAALQWVVDGLEVIKQFLIGLDYPIVALIQALIDQIQTLLDDLRASGVYELDVFPDFMHDPEMTSILGGYPSLVRKIVGSLNDVEDYNRPTFSSSAFMGGVVLMVNTNELGPLIKAINLILKFLDRNMRVEPIAPVNLQAEPSSEDGNPIFKLLNIVTTWQGNNSVEPPGTFGMDGVILEWGMPNLQLPGLGKPDAFIIERSKSKEGHFLAKYEPADTYESVHKTAVSSGGHQISKSVKYLGKNQAIWEHVATVAPDMVTGLTGAVASIIDGKVVDTYVPADSFWGAVEQEVIGVFADDTYRFWDRPEESHRETAFFDKLLGRDRYLGGGEIFDSKADAVKAAKEAPALGETYYYRVSAAYDHAVFDFDWTTVNLQLASDDDGDNTVPDWVTKIPRAASSPTTVTLPIFPEGVDMFSAISNTLQAAYALGFYKRASEFGTNPIPLGTESIPEIDFRYKLGYTPFVPEWVALGQLIDSTFGEIEAGIWQYRNRIFSRLLRNPTTAALFGQLYKDFQSTIDNQYIIYKGVVFAEVESGTPLGTAIDQTYLKSDTTTRAKVYKLIQLLQGTALTTGTPPNWKTIRPLEDILPWVDQIFTILMRKLKGMVAAYDTAVKALVDYITVLQRRVEQLLELVEFIEKILIMLVSLDVGIYTLVIPPSTGGVGYFIDQLQGAKPEQEADPEKKPPQLELPAGGPDDLAAGIVWAYGAPSAENLVAIKTAFGLIFGEE